MCSVIAIQILDAVLSSSGNHKLPQSDQALTKLKKIKEIKVRKVRGGLAFFNMVVK